MGYISILPNYLVWHYTQSFRDMTRVWTNLLWFLYHFFSISLLIRTLFAPWQRIREERVRGRFDLEDIAETLMTNTVMRLVGALMRIVVLVIGVSLIAIVFMLGLCFYVVWILFPALLPASFVYGLAMLVG